MLNKKAALFLSLAVTLSFALACLAASLGFAPAGQIRLSARPAESAALLTGRDEPGRLPTELLPGQTVDINSAPAEELALLPGIGETLSQAIVDYRQTNGPFSSLEALMEVPGIGRARFESLAGIIRIGDIG